MMNTSFLKANSNYASFNLISVGEEKRFASLYYNGFGWVNICSVMSCYYVFSKKKRKMSS